MAVPRGAPRCSGPYITRLAIEDTKFGLGSAMSWITVSLSVLFTLYFFRQLVKARIVR